MKNDLLDRYRFEAVAETDLTQAQEQAIAALIAPVYTQVDFEGRSFFQQRHHLRFMAWHGEVLVAHMALTYRAVRLGETLWDVMGIAEVVTHPDHRRHGLASHLLAMAREKADARGVDALLLFGTETLYGRAGFVRTLNPLVYVDMKGCRTAQTVEAKSHAMMVLTTGKQTWNSTATVDLLGALF
ncbi:MAG: GNAT family N-acetyltransferase [Pseudomonadota bacterium]